ncbi:MAG: AAA family ATPase [Candidatus Moraniibacteriota bacterium]
MYLKRLELNGFKSFANKTVLDFLPECEVSEEQKPARNTARGAVGGCGITAIVGPNGSGKSNVADGIRWAIGEQSSKNLRGKKSEDVIFSGSGKKARQGSASVTLHFDNSDKRIPIEYSDVAVTRKVYRSGESEYLINGNKVRLLDVVDLLARAGVGRDSYCVINQGMSDSLLAATPAERRSFFEDAAGVKPYQIEKDRATRKMDASRENLLRVATLLSEIEPHLKHLRRQAEKVAQAKTIGERLIGKQKELYGYLWAEFQGERERLMKNREQSMERLTALETVVGALQKETETLAGVMEEDGSLDMLSEAIAKFRTEKNERERALAVIGGRIEIEEEKKRDREEVAIITVDLTYVRSALERIRKDQEVLIAKIIAGKDDPAQFEELVISAEAIVVSMKELDEKAGKGSVVEKKIISLPESERNIIDERLAELNVERERLMKVMAELEQNIVEKENEVKIAREKSRSARERYFHLERELREKDQQLQKEKDAMNEMKVGLARVEVREEDLIAEVRLELNMEPVSLVFDGVPRDREKLTREISRLKVESEQAGGIDPTVLEEYDETEKRFQFLSQESEDLRQAMESLDAVVHEMDTKIDHAFAEAFENIAQEFERYFQLIFNGGKAELKKIRIRPRRKESEEGDEAVKGEETPEEGELGIEITACPPGKRIESLASLSGGERSLTSLALLFAIISHNPPPFAVLDEVEAALDEANSRRFSRILQDLGSSTQFIAITHNRETMRQAGLLYGVTMGADGVSQLLSVKLDKAEAIAK